MERLLAVWVRELAVEGQDGALARQFVDLLDELTVFCPFVEPVRFGLLVLPLRAPSRFFGGEEVVLAHIEATTREVIGITPQLGVGDGLFTAFAAARFTTVLAPGTSERFRRALPITALERRELTTVCRRLGVHTVGAFADLLPAREAERFSRDATHVHRVARGEESELRGQRDTRLAARLAVWRGEEVLSDVQSGFFGDHLDADRRAALVANRVRQRLGPYGVVTAALCGGRTPLERTTLLPWGATGEVRQGPLGPWPGQIPAPSPATTFAHPLAVQLFDAQHRAVAVDNRGLLSAPPLTVLFERGVSREIAWFAGPWPTIERWWSARRRRAYLQVLSAQGALLLYAERGVWWLAGIYD